MKRYSTDRLFAAVTLSVFGALIALLAGMPEVALFVAPWTVLGALGLAQQKDLQVQVNAVSVKDRLLVGDELELRTVVTATGAALMRVTPEFDRAFWPAHATETGRKAPAVVEQVLLSQPAEIRTELVADEWGTHDIGRTMLEAVAPYGLFRFQGAAPATSTVRVHPTPSQLHQLLSPWIVRRVSGTHRSKESAQGVEYADIREFGPGDSVRDINWRASARTGDLWVSQRHPDRATDVVMLVDSFVETGHEVRKIFGLLVEGAVALAESHLGATDRVGLIEFGGLVRWVSPATGRVQLQRLTDALLATGLYANAADKELPILPPRALPPRSFVVAFTPLLDQRFVEAVFTARGRGHDVAVIECSPRDAPQTEAPAAELISTRMWSAERAMLRDRMAEQGISVAQWSGDEPLDLTIGRLIRRRRAARVGGR